LTTLVAAKPLNAAVCTLQVFAEIDDVNNTIVAEGVAIGTLKVFCDAVSCSFQVVPLDPVSLMYDEMLENAPNASFVLLKLPLV
jgi:hypothetical protein